MISRDDAADVRYAVLNDKQPLYEVSRDYGYTVSTITRIVSGDLVPLNENRVVTQTAWRPRNRKLTVEQRVKIAYLICYGATLMKLARKHDVTLRTIQHIKENWTAKVENGTRRGKAVREGQINQDIAAEIRYRHEVLKQSVGFIAAALFLPYKGVYRVTVNKTYTPLHGQKLNVDGVALDAETPVGYAVRLWVYGATFGFIADSTDLEAEHIKPLISAYTEPA